MENLQNRKKEIILLLGEEGLRKLKFSKILKLLESNIQELMNYWTVKQAHQMVNEVFELNISAPLFYRFCLKNLKKDEKSEPIKRDKGVSQSRNTKKEVTLDADELSVVEMFSKIKSKD